VNISNATPAAIHCIGEVARAQTLTIRELLADGWRLTCYEWCEVCTVERGSGQDTGLGYNVNAEFYEMAHDGRQWREFERMLEYGELRVGRVARNLKIEP